MNRLIQMIFFSPKKEESKTEPSSPVEPMAEDDHYRESFLNHRKHNPLLIIPETQQAPRIPQPQKRRDIQRITRNRLKPTLGQDGNGRLLMHPHNGPSQETGHTDDCHDTRLALPNVDPTQKRSEGQGLLHL